MSKWPRGRLGLGPIELDDYENLILLCKVHHKVVDDQRQTFTVERLNNMKADHEQWVRNCLSGYDHRKQLDKEICASFVDEWINRGHLNDWECWTNSLLDLIRPELSTEVNNDFLSLREWLLKRTWPETYIELSDSFENFRRVIEDLQNTFHNYAEDYGDCLATRLFYELDEWDPVKWNAGYKKFVFHITLVHDLVLELVRSANHVCDQVRRSIDHGFRLGEGKLMVRIPGQWPVSLWQYLCPEYKINERISIPYPGLKKFLVDRERRDYSCGAGTNSDDPSFLECYKQRW
jgi:hypothetical protein